MQPVSVSVAVSVFDLVWVPGQVDAAEATASDKVEHIEQTQFTDLDSNLDSDTDTSHRRSCGSEIYTGKLKNC